ncbi:hypothetical protein, partial [Escherichia coli]|uniref:hypothetical protein n=1 Tax=Escherichia coli TaxID=562 RepID=UPI00144462C0
GYTPGTAIDNPASNSGYDEEEKPAYEKQEKHAKRKEHPGEAGVVAAGAFALYERQTTHQEDKNG